MPNVASPHLLSSRVSGGCPQAVGWGPARCLWDGVCVCQPWTAQLVMGPKQWDGEVRSWGVSLSTEPPNSQNFVPPIFPPVCPSHAAATMSRCDGGHRGTPTHHQLSSGLPTLGRPQTRQFCGIFSGASEGGMFRAHLQEKRLCWGRAGGGEEKRHSSAFGKREIVLEAVAAIADKSRSRQITPTLIQSRKALSSQRLAPCCAMKPSSISGEPKTSLSGGPATTDGHGCAPQRGRNICGVSHCPRPSFPAPSLTHLS